MKEELGCHYYYRKPYHHSTMCETFSVGIFRWVETKNKLGIKPGKVTIRVRGFTKDPDAVYEEADRIVRELDAGTYKGPKTVTVNG